MNDAPIKFDIRTGYLGWSNDRAGLEFFRGDGKNNRWEPRENERYQIEAKSGKLLQDDIEKYANMGEGSVCVVITCGTRDLEIAQRLAAELALAFERKLPSENNP